MSFKSLRPQLRKAITDTKAALACSSMFKDCEKSLSAVPHGFQYIPDFLSSKEHTTLLNEMESQPWDELGLIRKRGQVVRRRELDFLLDFGRLTHKLTPGRPLPKFLRSLRSKIARSLEVRSTVFQQVIATQYRPGSGIDWHTDAPLVFGDTICGISLASPCTMRFRHLETRQIWTIRLEPGSMYVMQHNVRWVWQHQIPEVKNTRFAITFRTLRLPDRKR